VESPSLEIFQPRLAAVLCPLLWVTLLGQGVGWGVPRGPCPPAMLDSVILFPLSLVLCPPVPCTVPLSPPAPAAPSR